MRSSTVDRLRLASIYSGSGDRATIPRTMPSTAPQRVVWDGHPGSLGIGFRLQSPRPFSQEGFVCYLRTALRAVCGPLAIALILAAPARAHAAVIPLTAADFAGTSLITFDGIPDGTPVNGMTVDGVLFNYLLNNVASNALVVDNGPADEQ